MSKTNTTGLKAFRLYRGVRIYRIVELLEVPTSKNAVPKRGTFNIWYCWTDGPKCETIDEVKRDIREFIEKCQSLSIEKTMAVRGLNEEL